MCVCQVRSCRNVCWMKDEQLIAVSINFLCLYIWLSSTHVRGILFCQVKVTSGKSWKILLVCVFFLLESCLITQLTRAWAQGVETNEGLPMWKWFPYRPARAFVLISRNELRLEKLSSGRRWGWDGAAAVAILPCNNCFSTETVDLLASRAPCIYWLKTARLKGLHWTWRWDFNSLVDRITKTYCGNMHC